MRIIVISGKSGHGKTTTANIIKDKLEEQGYDVLKIAYADLLKFICQMYFGWDGDKNDTGRDLLQYVGTDVIRKKSPDFFVNYLCEFLKIFENEWDYVVIDDARFPNEINLLDEYGFDYIHLRVVRPSLNGHGLIYGDGLSESQSNHLSETALDYITPDDFIFNEGDINYLKNTVIKCLEENIPLFENDIDNYECECDKSNNICSCSKHKSDIEHPDNCKESNNLMISKGKDGIEIKHISDEEISNILAQWDNEYKDVRNKLDNLIKSLSDGFGLFR